MTLKRKIKEMNQKMKNRDKYTNSEFSLKMKNQICLYSIIFKDLPTLIKAWINLSISCGV